jgi:histidine triad (HIT) family protein
MLVYNKSMSGSIFSKIISGEIPCHKIYEDEDTFAFLDIHPVQPGHVLVVPKQEVQFVWDLEDPIYLALMTTTKKLADRLREVMGQKYVGMKIEGVDVPHAHVHLIPFSKIEEFRNRPDVNAEPDHDSLSKVAQKVSF